MNREEFSKLLKADSFQKKDLDQIDKLIEEYPWFSIPKFLKLKAAYQLNASIDEEELSRLTAYSSDRKYLYLWMRNEIQSQGAASTLVKSEIEFLNDESSDDIDSVSSFELLEENNENEIDEAVAKAIPQKDEVDMEEPEATDPVIVPVIDSLDVDDEEVEEEIEEDETTSEDGYDDGSEKEDRIEKNSEKREIIEQFLKSDPGVIKADKETNLLGDISEDSVKEDDRFITDTLAKIYVKQGLHAKAIYAYERLSLKYPEKSAYFAAQIEKIKSISNI